MSWLNSGGSENFSSSPYQVELQFVPSMAISPSDKDTEAGEAAKRDFNEQDEAELARMGYKQELK
jgi:hypothetical protein